jgi:hypoxanthine phosphoribosyltransferase
MNTVSRAHVGTTEKIALSWGQVEEYTANVIMDLLPLLTERSILASDVVLVGIIRGGCIPATLLAHRLHTKRLLTVPPVFQTTAECRSLLRTCLRDVPRHPARSCLLLVDEICDSGATLKRMVEAARSLRLDQPIGTAVLCRWPDSLQETSDFDLCGHVLPAAEKEVRPWIIFPWETSL